MYADPGGVRKPPPPEPLPKALYQPALNRIGGVFLSITAKELAALLQLSESAVSLALNNRPGVSNATRKRVVEAARQHGYDFTRKSAVLTSLRGDICFVLYRKSGAIVADTPFFSALSEGISLGCRRARYNCVVRHLFADDEIEEQIYELRRHSFAGMIVLATEMQEPDLHYFADIPVPVLFLDAYFDVPMYNFLDINNTQGAFSATSHLIRKCRSQPGYLRSNYPISNFSQRADGFYRAIRAGGLSASKSPVQFLTPSQEGAYEDMKQWLAEGGVPERCYFADNDLIAIGAMEALREAGYRIPEDVAIVGFDDIPACEYMTPPLTTVAVPKLNMGQTAASCLIQMIEQGNLCPFASSVFTRLVRRKSV